MHDWHVTPEYINKRWTEEQFLLLFQKRNCRMRIEAGKPPRKEPVVLSESTILRQAGVTVKEF